jgi:hypothetical protein
MTRTTKLRIFFLLHAVAENAKYTAPAQEPLQKVGLAGDGRCADWPDRRLRQCECIEYNAKEFCRGNSQLYRRLMYPLSSISLR